MNAMNMPPSPDRAETAAAPPAVRLLPGLAWAMAAVLIFAGWFVVTRFSVTHELRVWDVTALRFGIGALVLSPALFPKGRPLPLAAWGKGLVFSALWGAPFVLAVARGLQLTSAAQAATVAPTLMPVFSGALAWLFLKERQSKARLLGYAAILFGIAGLMASNPLAGGAPDLGGLAWLALGSAMWAGYTIRFKQSALTPMQAAALICFWSALLFLPVYALTGLSHLDRAALGEVLFQAGYQGVLMSVVALFSFNHAVTLLGPVAATAMIALVPVAASLLAIPVLGETPAPLGWLAIAVVVAGVVLAARNRPAPSAIPTIRSTP